MEDKIKELRGVFPYASPKTGGKIILHTLKDHPPFFSRSSNYPVIQKHGEKNQTCHFFSFQLSFGFFPLFVLSSERTYYSIPNVKGIPEGDPFDNLV